MDDHVGAREVQARAARLERNQEDRTAAAVELLDEAQALERWRAAVEVEIRHAELREALADVREHRRELRKNQHAVAGRDGVRHDFFEHVELA